MLFGKYASRKGEAQFPALWDGLVFFNVSAMQSPSGGTAYDFSGRNRHITLTSSSVWTRQGFAFDAGLRGSIPASVISDVSGFAIAIRVTPSVATGERYFFDRAGTESLAIGMYSGRFMIYRGGFLLSSVSVVVGQTYTLILNYAKGVSTLWVNGSSQITNGSAVTAGSGALFYGSYSTGGFVASGNYLGLAIYNRGLQNGEITLLSSRFDAALQRRPVLSFGSSFNRRRRLLVGAGS